MADPAKLSSLVLIAWLARTAVGCTSAVDIHTIQSPAAHFERYRTIAFDLNQQAPREYTTSPRSADVRAYVEQTAARILEGRGYVIAPNDHADLVVRIEAGRREQK